MHPRGSRGPHGPGLDVPARPAGAYLVDRALAEVAQRLAHAESDDLAMDVGCEGGWSDERRKAWARQAEPVGRRCVAGKTMSGDSGFDEVPGSERDGGVSWTRAVAAIAVDGGLRFVVVVEHLKGPREGRLWIR
jgi:hypothetical protein